MYIYAEKYSKGGLTRTLFRNIGGGGGHLLAHKSIDTHFEKVLQKVLLALFSIPIDFIQILLPLSCIQLTYFYTTYFMILVCLTVFTQTLHYFHSLLFNSMGCIQFKYSIH